MSSRVAMLLGVLRVAEEVGIKINILNGRSVYKLFFAVGTCHFIR
jgi:hypothetical protein